MKAWYEVVSIFGTPTGNLFPIDKPFKYPDDWMGHWHEEFKQAWGAQMERVEGTDDMWQVKESAKTRP